MFDSMNFSGRGTTVVDRLLDATQTGVVLFDAEGTVIRANSVALNDLRMSETDMPGRRITDVLSVIRDNENILPALIARLRAGGAEYLRLPPDSLLDSGGKVRFFATGRIAKLNEEGTGLLLSFRNVVNELTQESMLKMALNNTLIFPWFYDMERKKMFIDPRYFDYTGIVSEDCSMTMETFAAHVYPDDWPPMADALQRQLNGEHYPYPVPFRLLRGDGRYEWFEGQSTYLGQVDGLPYRVVGTCMSTQAHKDVEHELIAARDRAEQSDRLKSAFLANMSHEIRTPLNAIVGFSNLLAGGEVAPDSEEAREYVSLINTNCNYLLTLVSDILDLSRIETGAMEYVYGRHSLRRIMSDLYQNHLPGIPAGVVLEMSVPEEDTLLETDAVRLRQIMDNLLNNARKFTREGTVTFGYALSPDGGSAELFVADTGCGIPADRQEKIFERFYKIDTFAQGAGLGLSICRTIAGCLGGNLAVTSRPGEGSRFTLVLPLSRRDDTHSDRHE